MEQLISTLAPREGSDFLRPVYKAAYTYFYPRSPRGERPPGFTSQSVFNLFLPSLPARGATLFSFVSSFLCGISTLAPREGSDLFRFYPQWTISISTLAPREGSDLMHGGQCFAFAISTLAPREGSDMETEAWEALVQYISTLAPREGSDAHQQLSICVLFLHFYPRSPRGERRYTKWCINTVLNFYPRSPRGERRPCCGMSVRATNFYPRSPRGERPEALQKATLVIQISTLAPREGSDRSCGPVSPASVRFLPSLPARGATRP